MPPPNPPIIDCYTTPGTERDTSYSVAELLRDMDAAGIARAVIAPQDREIAIDNAAGNRRIAAMARTSGGGGGRLIPACTVNPWRGSEGCDLLGHAVADGARLLVLSGALQGFIPTDEVVNPLLDAAGRLGVPVYFHTGPHSAGGPTQVVLAALTHPGTRFILGHGGSTDHAWDMPAILKHHAPANLWFDLSFVRPWALPAMADAGGTARLIWGSGAPRNVAGFELRQADRHLPVTQNPGVYGGNLLAVLEFEG